MLARATIVRERRMRARAGISDYNRVVEPFRRFVSRKCTVCEWDGQAEPDTERDPVLPDAEELARHVLRVRELATADHSRFSASYTLPSEIDPNQIKANFRDGILTIEMPKTEQAKSKAIKVNVAGG